MSAGMRTFSDRLRGIHAATIVPMTSDFALDEPRLADHLAAVASTPGINGLLVNGHAGENFVLSFDEKRRVVELARQNAPKECLIVSGVNHESSLEAGLQAATLERARAAHEKLYPLAVAIYRDAPGGRATVRLKACLKRLGRLSCDAVRPPQPPATPNELRALDQALRAAGAL